MLRRLPTLLELELVLDGEEVWTPLVADDGEDGRESRLFEVLRLNIGSLETRVERRDPVSPISTVSQPNRPCQTVGLSTCLVSLNPLAVVCLCAQVEGGIH